MKNLRLASLCVVVVFAFQNLHAQEDLVKYFPAAEVDASGNILSLAGAEELIGLYVQPMGDGLTSAMNNGWYNSAKTHKKFGFDIHATFNVIFIPSTEELFQIPASSNATDVLGTGAPSVYGDENLEPILAVQNGSNSGLQFDGPTGIEVGASIPLFKALVVPTLQLGVGLWKNTDLRLRYTPTFKIDEADVGSWGFGFMHDIKQHIGPLKLVPMSLTLLVAYTQLNVDVDLAGEWSDQGNGDQKGEYSANGFTAQILVGKNFPWIGFYGGLGYNSGNGDFDVNGTYVIDDPVGTQPGWNQFTVSNPGLSYSYEASGVRGTIGMRLKFGPLMFNGDYTLFGLRNILTIGTGFTFN